MRYSLKDGLVLGVAIGAAVLIVRAFVPQAASIRIIVLLLLAVLLMALQLALGVRRARMRPHKPVPPTPTPPRTPRLDKPKNVFASEANQAWTGLQSTDDAPEEHVRAERISE